MNQDLRKTPRKKPEGLVYVEFGSENGGMIRDLSENGMGFRSVGPLRPAEKVPFSFSFDGEDVLRGEAQMIWADGDGRSGGLVFVDISEGLRSKLRTWCTREVYQPGAQPARTETNSTASTFEELRNELRSQISPALAGASTAVAEFPSIHGKTRLVSPVAEAAQVREDPANPGRATSADISSSVGTETGQTTPSEQPHPAESKANETKPVITSRPSYSVSQSFPPPSPLIAPLSFDREVNLGLESRLPLQGSLPEPTWVEKLTVSWVIVAMLVLSLAAAGFVFRNEVGQSFIWLGAKIAGTDQPAPVVQQPPVLQQPGLQQPAAPTASDASSAGPVSNPGTEAPAPDSATPRTNVLPANVTPSNATGKTGSSPEKQKNQAATPSSLSPSASNNKAPTAVKDGIARADDRSANAGLGADNPLNASPSSASAGDDENGQNALQQAMLILRSDRRSTNIAEAVRLLWIAVEHGSSEAEVVLADLYRTGEGVAQSCDQTHILLTAAARKGNNEAKSRLVEIAHTGCP